MRRSDGYKSSWVVTCKDSTKTAWGEVKAWGGIRSTCVKMITMHPGMRTSFKYNKLKDEMLICTAGKVLAYYSDEQLVKNNQGDLQVTELTPGTALIVQSECLYRLEAIEESTIVEVSTGPDGSVRFDDDYGRKVSKNDYIEKIIKKWWRN